MSLIEKVKEVSSSILNELIDARRHLHQNPELSFEEHKTAEFIEQFLTKLGLESIRVFGAPVAGF